MEYQIGDRVIVIGKFRGTVVEIDTAIPAAQISLDPPPAAGSLSFFWLGYDALEPMNALEQLGETAE